MTLEVHRCGPVLEPDQRRVIGRTYLPGAEDQQQLEARLASAAASLRVAEAALVQAEATRVEVEARADRSRELAVRNLVSREQLEADTAAARRAVAAVESAEAQVSSARAALNEAQTALGKAVVRAPIDGLVISREIEPGQTVAAAFQTPVLFKLVEDLRQMRLLLNVDEADIGSIREGQRATFRVDAYPRREFNAEILSVRFNPRMVNNVVTYETLLSVDNPDLLLRPGMTATAEIQVAEKDNVTLVPNRALRFLPPDQREGPSDSPDRVWVLQDGRAVRFPVQTGLTNTEFTEVLSPGLQAGDQVVVDIAPVVGGRSGGLFQ